MCSNQLSLFSDDSLENESSVLQTQTVENKVNSTNKLEENNKRENLEVKNLLLTEEDLKVNQIEQEYNSFEILTDELRNLYDNKIKSVALGCLKCELSKTRIQVVYSQGNTDSPIMLIGEGPGENEDLSGIPFVGKAGQLLDKILASGGISRENDVYITNVVKCRPPKNRAPFQNEIDACSIYLNNQLKLSKAKIILLTGATAMSAILGQSQPITKVRGNWIEKDDKWIMPIFHPAYLLRNPSKDVGSPKWLMWQDIKKVKQKLDQILQESKDN